MTTQISGSTGIDKVQSGAVETGDLPTGSVLQVVSAIKTDTTIIASVSTNNFTDLGLSASITPSSASSTILVRYDTNIACNTGTAHLRLMRDSSPIAISDADGNRLRSTQSIRTDSTMYIHECSPASMTYKDAPSTTSSTTYKVQGTLGSSYNGSIYVNRSVDAVSNTDWEIRSVSTITLMEIAG